MSYLELLSIFSSCKTWDDFITNISFGDCKWIFLRALETGWLNKIRRDLLHLFDVSESDVDSLLERYMCLVRFTPRSVSSTESLRQLASILVRIDVLRGYLRYAYYVKLDDTDDVVACVDEVLSEMSGSTPSSSDCAESYTHVTGVAAISGAVVIPGKTAEGIATHIAIRIEELQSRLTRARSLTTEQISAAVQELEQLDNFHCMLTGKGLVSFELLLKKIQEETREK